MTPLVVHAPLSIAHRGARAHAPENTLAAARLGHAEHAHMWELDTGLTQDGHLVVIHDDTLTRTTDVAKRPEFADRAPWNVADFTLAELRSLDAGSWFAEKDPFKTVAAREVTPEMIAAYHGEKIPTLEEALLLTRELGWQVNVEIKDHARRTGHALITKKVLDLVRSLAMQNMVLLSSFQHQYLRQAAELMPELPRAALVEGERPADSTAVCLQAVSAYYHPDHSMLLPGEVQTLAAAGIKTNVWTVNSIPDMQRAVNLGVNGIITDFPARLATLLAAQPPSPTALR